MSKDITVTMPEALHRAARDYCASQEVPISLSALIRALLRERINGSDEEGDEE